jgi:hypothetical protein
MKTFRLIGNIYDFQDADQYVYKGDFIMVRASGWITTRAGEAAGPDGKTNKGETFDAVDDVWGKHHTLQHKKYTLLIKVGDDIIASGKDVVIQSPVDGRLQFAINDNNTMDNSGFWAIQFECGARLRQRILFVNHNVPDPAGQLSADMENCCATIERSSFDVLSIGRDIHMAASYTLQADDFIQHLNDQTKKPDGFTLHYNQRFMAYLNEQGYDLSDYQLIFRIYRHEPHLPPKPNISGRVFYKIYGGGDALYPYVSVILADNTSFYNAAEWPLADVLLHEYLHIIDEAFMSVGVPEFASPHSRDKNAILYNKTSTHIFDLNREYYKATLGLLEDGFTTPPYARLSGIFGSLES